MIDKQRITRQWRVRRDFTIYDPPADIKRHAWLLLTTKMQDVKCLPLLSSATSEAFLLAVFQTTEAIFPSLTLLSPSPLFL